MYEAIPRVRINKRGQLHGQKGKLSPISVTTPSPPAVWKLSLSSLSVSLFFFSFLHVLIFFFFLFFFVFFVFLVHRFIYILCFKSIESNFLDFLLPFYCSQMSSPFQLFMELCIHSLRILATPTLQCFKKKNICCNLFFLSPSFSPSPLPNFILTSAVICLFSKTLRATTTAI